MNMTEQKVVKIGDYFDIANNKPFFLIAGPCQIENVDHSLFMAESIKKVCDKLKINYCFKSSFDKANRGSVKSKRGIGLDEGCRILENVKKKINVPVLTDIHLHEQAKALGEVCDIIQIPAFLSRQLDLLKATAEQKKPIHVKKMQYAAPWTMESIYENLKSFGNDQVILCDRGTAFGYNSQIIDMRSFPIMAKNGIPVSVDCTHASQHPGGKVTGGNRDMAQVWASAAVAVGVAGVFAEVHQDPQNAPSDSACMICLDKLEKILKRLTLIDKIAKENPLEIENYTILS
jgi:2-dehydro-3-deoxyphosphooctonate aldolase (KDO 8-P synthase)